MSILFAITVLLVALACVSPTLTLLSLWQLKEWRWDRLTEHLKREGILSQLFGRLRPAILGIWIVLISLFIAAGNPSIASGALIGLLPLLALLSCIQIAVKKQPMPMWTMKALLLFGISMLIPVVLSILVRQWSASEFSLIVLMSTLPFLCPLWVLLSWLTVRPLDRILKTRIMNKAMENRRRHSKITVIAVTGSVGKTTTKELLAHILKAKGAIATPVHVNTEMGVATWLIDALKDKPADWPGILIVEMGAYHKGEIRLLCEIAQPRYGIVTYIGHQHLSLFGSTEAIAEAKGELIEVLPENGRAFINGDNEASAPLQSRAKCPVTIVDTGGKTTLSALDIEETSGGLRFNVQGTAFAVPVAGTHLVTGILLAIACARELGMDLATIAKSLRTFKSLPRTFEVKEVNGITVLDDTYNASPDSFRAAMEWARSQPHDEKVLLTDGIIELGHFEAEIHEELAADAADIFTRAVIGHPRFLAYFLDHGFGDRAALLSFASQKIQKGGLLVCIGRMPRNAIERLLPR